jgi:N,N'-diacetyllegionaminate synthase
MVSTFILAEAGVNHNGDIELAKRMIDAAAGFDADAIKFQTFRSDKLVIRTTEKAKYQMKTTDSSESQFDMLKRLELNDNQHYELIRHCQKKCIKFLSTAFDLESIDLLESIRVPMHKIPSGEITNLPYLIKIARTGKPIILSTGMSSLGEVKAAVEILRQNGSGKITVLHCNTEYPTPYEDVNLNAMLTMQRELGVKVGYSDHTPGIEVPIAAVAMGAVVIEKHFTLDKNMEGPDHKASLEPDEFAAMVQAIRNIEKALGNGKKKPSPSEIKNIVIARKSIVAQKSIKTGEKFTEDNITVKRPGNGISPMKWFEVLGTTAMKDFTEDELIVI